MNLSLGEIELNGVIFDKKTNIDELMGNPKFSAYVNNSSPIGILTSKQVSVDGYTNQPEEIAFSYGNKYCCIPRKTGICRCRRGRKAELLYCK